MLGMRVAPTVVKALEGEEHDLLKRAAEMTDEELFAELKEAGVSIDG